MVGAALLDGLMLALIDAQRRRLGAIDDGSGIARDAIGVYARSAQAMESSGHTFIIHKKVI